MGFGTAPPLGLQSLGIGVFDPQDFKELVSDRSLELSVHVMNFIAIWDKEVKRILFFQTPVKYAAMSFGIEQGRPQRYKLRIPAQYDISHLLAKRDPDMGIFDKRSKHGTIVII